MKHIDFVLWDAVALQLAFIIAYAIRQGGSTPYVSVAYRTLAVMLAVVDILIAAVFNTMHNVMKRGYYQEAIQTFKQALMVLVFTTFNLFAMQSGDVYSRVTLCLTAIFHIVLGYGIRLAWKPAVRRLGKNSRKAAMILVADGKRAPEILERLSSTDN